VRKVWFVLGWCFCVALPGYSQAVLSQPSWVVKPEWVRAHEEFLASDVMGGRGSATREEEITATYVASEFMAYGLKPAPGTTGYIQAAELEAPALDGKATLMVGALTLVEGTDFHLLTSSGASVRGPLARVTGVAVASGSVLLVSDVPGAKNSMDALRQVGRLRPAMTIVVDDDSTRRFWGMDGETRVRMGLKGATSGMHEVTLVAVSGAAMEKLLAVGAAAEAVLEVHPKAVPVRKTFNAIGWLAGSQPDSGTLLLSAHLDHLGVGRSVQGDAIYNGANDDAAGTTAVLELAHALAAGPQPKRNILFVCYGSEELGGLGSTYFGAHPPVPLMSLVANLEFEMIGNQDPKMPKGVLLLTGWERSNLGPTLKEHGALLGPDPYPEQHFFQRSDNYSLALMGVVAHTAAGWGTPPTYHQPSDDLQHLDLGFMTAAIQSLVEPVRWLATSDFKPEWNPGGQPKGRE
jgi:hypothetical protein